MTFPPLYPNSLKTVDRVLWTSTCCLEYWWIFCLSRMIAPKWVGQFWLALTPGGLPRWHHPRWVKNPPANAGEPRGAGSVSGLGRSPGGKHNNPWQYSCLENPMDRESWQTTVHRVTKSRTQLKWLSTHTCTFSWTHIQGWNQTSDIYQKFIVLEFTRVE